MVCVLKAFLGKLEPMWSDLVRDLLSVRTCVHVSTQVTYNHIQCAGKIFKAVGEYDDPTKWYQECQLMSSLHHPNITQFLGLYFPDDKTQLPILVMERLETTLHTLVLDMPNLPLSLKCSVLTDVASGLLYLHARPKPVAHKDLRARNVLLTSSLVAKITDIGFPHIANPGMNPNQMLASSIYKSSWDNRQPPDDIYDFGYLALFTLLQVRHAGSILLGVQIVPRNKDTLWPVILSFIERLSSKNLIVLWESYLGYIGEFP